MSSYIGADNHKRELEPRVRNQSSDLVSVSSELIDVLQRVVHRKPDDMHAKPEIIVIPAESVADLAREAEVEPPTNPQDKYDLPLMLRTEVSVPPHPARSVPRKSANPGGKNLFDHTPRLASHPQESK